MLYFASPHASVAVQCPLSRRDVPGSMFGVGGAKLRRDLRCTVGYAARCVVAVGTPSPLAALCAPHVAWCGRGGRAGHVV